MKREAFNLTVTPEIYEQIRTTHDWTVYGSGPMFGEWQGWSVRGGDLVSPWGQRVSRAMIERFLREASIRGAKLISRGVKGPSAPSVTRTRGLPDADNVVPLRAPTEPEGPSAPR